MLGTRLSQELLERRHRVMSPALSVSYADTAPLTIVRGQGCWLYDDKGTAFLDTRNNVAHVGHCHPGVVAAVSAQVAAVNTNTRYLHPTTVALAERLLATFPEPLNRVFFVNSGSEANDLALRLARTHTRGAEGVVVIQHGYHGHTGACMAISPYKYNHVGGDMYRSACTVEVPCPAGPAASASRPGTKAASGTPTVGSPARRHGALHDGSSGKAPATASGACRDPPGMEAVPPAGGSRLQVAVKVPVESEAAGFPAHVATDVGAACENLRARGHRVAAFIAESGMSVGGVILPPDGYMKQAYERVRSAGGVCIADEVQVGFGRFGSAYFWGFQQQGVVPDIVTLGKPFGNGMPLAAVVTTTPISDSFGSCGLEYFNTFGGNPVCAAAGLAVLDALLPPSTPRGSGQPAAACGTRQPSQPPPRSHTDTTQSQSVLLPSKSVGLVANADRVGRLLVEGFRRLASRHSLIRDVRGLGLFIGVEFATSREEARTICLRLKDDHHILTSFDGPGDNVMVIKPPMCFGVQEGRQLLTAVDAVLSSLRAGDQPTAR